MSPFDALAGSVISTVLSVYGSATAFVYSRPGNASLNAIAAFPITGALNAGGAFTSPTGPLAAALMVNPADIPLGPQKGDLVGIASAPAPMKSGTYKVQEFFMDPVSGWANLELRFVQ